MASDFDRDNSIDALLRGARRDADSAEAGPACLDAETVAAWADGVLDASRVRAIEAHVADCARCQALSAAFFATDEPVAANAPNVVPFRRNRVMYWMPIAAGTVAATLVIWLGVRDQKEETSQAVSMSAASRAAETQAPAADAPRLQYSQEQQGNVAVPADAKRLERKAPAPVQLHAERARQEKAAAPPPPKPATPVLPPPAIALATPLPPPPPPPAIVAAPPVGTTASGVVGGVVGGAGGVRQSSELMAKAEPRIVAEFSSVLPPAATISGLPSAARVAGGAAGGGAGRGGGGGGGRGAAIALDAVDVSAPPFYWRILSTDVIERSLDRLMWETIPVTPPVQGLAGGAAPSATVCWIIGRGGLVLLTTDGKEFTRLTQPAPADLISITAQNALRATVTTTGGQTFSTTDGGKTWK